MQDPTKARPTWRMRYVAPLPHCPDCQAPFDAFWHRLRIAPAQALRQAEAVGPDCKARAGRRRA